jgi:hypothetical protein
VTDVFEEVNQSLAQESALKWWKILLPYLVITGVIVVGAVGASEFMKSQRASDIEKSAKVFDTAATALEKKDLAGARMAFSQLGQGQGGYAVISNHMLANVEKELTNDPAAIEKALDAAAAKDKGLMGSLATLKAAYAKADTADLAELEKELKPVIDKKGYAAALARELIAAKALSAGDVERARGEYQSLALEIEAPGAMKERAEQALNTLPPPGAAPAAAAPAAATPAAPAATPPAKPAQ